MGIDASIYQMQRPVEVPSIADSMQKASSLKQMAMQQDRMGQEMSEADRAEKMRAHLQKASVFGNALESVVKMPPAQRPQAYAQMRQQMVQDGIIKPEDAPDEYDESYVRPTYNRFMQSKEGMEKQLMRSEIAKNYASMKDKKPQDEPKQLPSDKVLAVSDGQRIPSMLEDITGTLENNKDSFGPIGGRLSAMNPYDEKAQTIDAQMRAGAQSFGKFMEGGVLRKEDEEKYRKMFPTLSDTHAVATNKLRIVDRLLKQKQAADVEALRASGYDTKAFANGGQTPGVPKILSGQGGDPGFGVPNANAGDGAPMLKMQAPDGSVRMIPASQKREAIAAGGKVIQ